MSLSTNERTQLFFIAWGKQPSGGPEELLAQNLVKKTEKGFEVTPEGLAKLSPMARTALQRPGNYFELSGSEQWAIDKSLGILDWDGD